MLGFIRLPRMLVATIVTAAFVSSAMTVAVMLILLPAVAVAQAERLQASGYQLVGPDGSDWGAIEVTRNPQGQLVSSLRLNQGGVLRARMETGRNSPEAAALTLRDTSEQVRIRLALASSLVPGQAGDANTIDVLDQEQHIRVHIGVDGAGSPFIQLLDGDGQVSWSAP